MTCQFNPFNPDAPKAFDAIVGRGLSGASRWLEKTVGSQEWARRFDAMDRRFMPERDLPLISYETQWSLLHRAMQGHAYPELAKELLEVEGNSLKNDARLVFEKLSQSRAMLVQVTQSNDTLPYYEVKNVFDETEDFLYVDFGDQEPLEAGSLMFGRFLIHENCLYVIPGVFVGTADVLGLILDAIMEFLDEPFDQIDEAMQDALPEIWNLCTAIQDERDAIDSEGSPEIQSQFPEDPCRATLPLKVEKREAVSLLRAHPLFAELDAPEFGYDPFGDALFEVSVKPNASAPPPSLEGEEDDEEETEDEYVRVGATTVSNESIVVTAVNPIELELVKALVSQLVNGETPE